jgi:hypothetical protein
MVSKWVMKAKALVIVKQDEDKDKNIGENNEIESVGLHGQDADKGNSKIKEHQLSKIFHPPSHSWQSSEDMFP